MNNKYLGLVIALLFIAAFGAGYANMMMGNPITSFNGDLIIFLFVSVLAVAGLQYKGMRNRQE